MPELSKDACHNRSCRSQLIALFFVQDRNVGASGKRVIVRRAPDKGTTVAVVGFPALTSPTSRSASDAGLHCGDASTARIHDTEAAPRFRVCALSLTGAVACASITRSVPLS